MTATSQSSSDPILLSLPARSEWEWVARRVLLAYAHSLGMNSLRLEELGFVIGRMWDEVALAPGVEQATLTMSAAEADLSLVLEGNRGRDDDYTDERDKAGEAGWSTHLTSTLIAHLSHKASIVRTSDRLLIEASFLR